MTFSFCRGWGLAWEGILASSVCPASPASACRAQSAGPGQVGTARSPPTRHHMLHSAVWQDRITLIFTFGI